MYTITPLKEASEGLDALLELWDSTPDSEKKAVVRDANIRLLAGIGELAGKVHDGTLVLQPPHTTGNTGTDGVAGFDPPPSPAQRALTLLFTTRAGVEPDAERGRFAKFYPYIS